MARIKLGVFLILFGLGVCVCGPFLSVLPEWMANADKEHEYFSSDELYQFTVDEPGTTCQLCLVTSGVIDGVQVQMSQADLPSGMYGFADADGNNAVELSDAKYIEPLSVDDVDMVGLGYDVLAEGTYTVSVPASDQNYHMMVIQYAQLPIDRATIWFMVGLLFNLFCLVAGSILVVSGARQAVRDKRANADQPAGPEYDGGSGTIET